MHKERDWIHSVEEGMDVYDTDGDKVGTIESLRYGTKGDAKPIDETDDDSIVEEVAETFTPDDFPEEVEERLLQEGYIRVDKGILQGYGYVPNSSIRTVNDDGVHLNIERDGILIRR